MRKRSQRRRPQQRKGRPMRDGPSQIGGDLLSQALASQVPSALRGLTALFGMGRGVSPSLSPPKSGETGRADGRTPPSADLENRTAGRTSEDQKIRQALEPLVPVC